MKVLKSLSFYVIYNYYERIKAEYSITMEYM